MKLTTYILSIILIGGSWTAHAQRKYTTQTILANNKTYNFRVSKIGNQEQVAVYGQGNKYYNSPMKSPYIQKYNFEQIGIKPDTAKIKRIVAEVVGQSNIIALARTPANNLSVYLTFNTQGKVLETVFYTGSTTRITPEMFEEMDSRLKKEIVATFNEHIPAGLSMPFYKTFEFINYNQQIYFNKMVVN